MHSDSVVTSSVVKWRARIVTPAKMGIQDAKDVSESSETTSVSDDGESASEPSDEDVYVELPARTVNLQSASCQPQRPDYDTAAKDPGTAQAFAACQKRGRRRSSLAEVIADWPLLEHQERPEFRVHELAHVVNSQRFEVIPREETSVPTHETGGMMCSQ